MYVKEEILAKLLKYKVENELADLLTAIESQWSGAQTIGTVSIEADPIVGFKKNISEIIISGWEEMPSIEQLMRVSRLPCIYVFVVEVTPSEILFQQETVDGISFACSLKIIDQGSNYDSLEKKLYRYTDGLYQLVRGDRFLSGSGWFIDRISKAYSATEPTDPLLKAGQVSFVVTMADVYE